MPSVFCLNENYEDSAKCLYSLRNKLTAGIQHSLRKRIRPRPSSIKGYYDFSTIKKLSPSAALVFASEFDRARVFNPINIPLIERKKWQEHVVQLLSDIGFFDLLEINLDINRNQESNFVRMTHFQTGELVGNREAGKLIRMLAEMITAADIGALGDRNIAIQRIRLFDALVEATENSRHHAYPEHVRTFYQVQRWWMTGAVYSKEKRITIVVYDQGISIPGSLPGWSGFAWIEKILQRFLGRTLSAHDDTYDAYRLRLAMKKPRSSTGMSNRGKGLPLLKEVVDQCAYGRLRIISRRGALHYETGGRLNAETLETALPGTLIEWDLWL